MFKKFRLNRKITVINELIAIIFSGEAKYICTAYQQYKNGGLIRISFPELYDMIMEAGREYKYGGSSYSMDSPAWPSNNHEARINALEKLKKQLQTK